MKFKKDTKSTKIKTEYEIKEYFIKDQSFDGPIIPTWVLSYHIIIAHLLRVSSTPTVNSGSGLQTRFPVLSSRPSSRWEEVLGQ